MQSRQILPLALLVILLAACSSPSADDAPFVLFERGEYPSIVHHNGTYYYTMQEGGVNRITIYAADTLQNLSTGRRREILTPESGMRDIYSPELHRIGGRWCVYFEGDDGNTDNHQIYMLENQSDDPLQGQWTMHGPIITNQGWNFGIHPNTIVVGARQYLLWSGWQKQRIESEEQCLFIAEMENPWTLKSQRTLISKPEYEWERQWINPDGTRSAYPIFVNENPEAFLSPDGKRIFVAYSASGIWTVYNTLGLLQADTSADLLNPASWHKSPEPLFRSTDPDHLFGTSNIAIVSAPSPHVVYQAKNRQPSGQLIYNIRAKPLTWSTDNLPLFGQP